MSSSWAETFPDDRLIVVDSVGDALQVLTKTRLIIGKVTVRLTDDKSGEEMGQDEFIFAVRLIVAEPEVQEACGSDASINFIDSDSFKTEYVVDLQAQSSSAKVEIKWPGTEIKGLEDGCLAVSSTEVSFSGADSLAEDWVTEPDLENRSMVLDPASTAFKGIEGEQVVSATIAAILTSEVSGEVLTENSFSIEITLKGSDAPTFSGVPSLSTAFKQPVKQAA